MIRFRLSELLLDRSFHSGRRMELGEVAKATGIHRATLSKLANQRGYNTTTNNLDRLCAHLQCTLSELAEYVPDVEVGDLPEKTAKGPKPQAKVPASTGATREVAKKRPRRAATK